jgi:chromosome segregation protein
VAVAAGGGGDAPRQSFERQSALEEKRTSAARLNQRVQDAQQAVFDLRSQKEQAENRPTWRRSSAADLEDRLESSRDKPRRTRNAAARTRRAGRYGGEDKQSSSTCWAATPSSSSAIATSAIVEGELSRHEQEFNRRSSSCSSMRARWRGCAPTRPATKSTRRPAHSARCGGRRKLRACASPAGGRHRKFGEVEARVEEALVEKSRAQEVTAPRSRPSPT